MPTVVFASRFGLSYLLDGHDEGDMGKTSGPGFDVTFGGQDIATLI